MKFKLWSDLHIEGRHFDYTPEDGDKDLTLILAGDIGTIQGGLLPFLIEMADTFKHVVYVYGNHEFYNNTIDKVKHKVCELTTTVHNLIVLDNNKIVIDGVRILGTPLWTELGNNPLVMQDVKTRIFDYTVTRIMDNKTYTDGVFKREARNITPEDHRYWYNQAVLWLKFELNKEFDGKTMVVTHWAPTHKLTEIRFKGNFLNPYFTNDLDYLFHYYDIDTWCYGHTHGKIFVDYGNDEFNGTRIINNPRGYAHEDAIHQLNPEMVFEPNRVFEV